MAPYRPRHNAFTLIELLVVIAVLSVLVALLLPSLGTARLAAKRVVAATNLRQAGVGIGMYQYDFNDQLPGHSGAPLGKWVHLIEPYTDYKALYLPTACPDLYFLANPARSDIGSVVCNINIMGAIYSGATEVRRPHREVRHPARVFNISHAGGGFSSWSPTHLEGGAAGTSQYNPALEGTGINIHFLDGHIEFMNYQGHMLSKWWTVHPNPPPSSSGWIYRNYQLYGW